MQNDFPSRNGAPINFTTGLMIKGVNISGDEGAKVMALKVKASDTSATSVYDWIRSMDTTVASILQNGVASTGSVTVSQISDASSLGVSLLKATSTTQAQTLLGVGAATSFTISQISDASTIGKALMSSASATAARGYIGLGTAATQNTTAFATAIQGTKADTALQPGVLPAGTTIVTSQISDASAFTKDFLTATSAATAQTKLGLGSAAIQASTAFATSTQGGKADTALQPGVLPAGTTIVTSQISDSSSLGRSLLTVNTQADLKTLVGVAANTNVTISQISDAGATGAAILAAGSTTAAQAAIGLPNASTALQPGALPLNTTVTINQISDANAWSRTFLTASNTATAWAQLGLGSAAGTAASAFATAAQGSLASTALQPGALPAGTTIASTQISNASALGRQVLTAATAALAQSYLGLGTAATQNSTAFATAAQGALADTSLQPSSIGVTVAGLSGGKLSSSVIPDIAIVQYLGSVASQTAMLALTGQQGDWCIRSDLGTTWVITGATPTVIGSWTQLSYPTAPVTSVAGKTGAVTLAAADISDASTIGKGVLTATTAAIAQTALGLGSAAGYAASAFATAAQGTLAGTALQPGALPLSTTVTINQISDANAWSRTFLTANSASSGRTQLGLGTAAVSATTDFATALQGSKANTALQPGTNLTQTVVSATSLAGSQLITAADTASMRSVLGLGTAALNNVGDFATAAQGTKANTALQPSQAGGIMDQYLVNGVTLTGAALMTSTSVAVARANLALGPGYSSDVIAYQGTWAGRPGTNIPLPGNRIVITDVGVKGRAAHNYIHMVLTYSSLGSYYYSLLNGSAVIYDYIGSQDTPTTGYSFLAMKINSNLTLTVPGDFLSPVTNTVRYDLEFTIDQNSVDASNRSIIYIRFGSTGTDSDRLIGTYPISGNSITTVIRASFTLEGYNCWTYNPPLYQVLPFSNYNIAFGTSNYFTVWVAGGASGESSMMRQQRVVASF